MAIPYRIVIPSNTILVSINEIYYPDPRLMAQAGAEQFKELCRCPRLQEAVGVGVYKFHNPIVVFRVGVAQATALYDFALAQ